MKEFSCMIITKWYVNIWNITTHNNIYRSVIINYNLINCKTHLIIIWLHTLNTSHHDARFTHWSSGPVLTMVQNCVWFGRGVCWPGKIPALPATPNSASLVSQAGGIFGAKGEASQFLAQGRWSHYLLSDTPAHSSYRLST